jgi:poly(A) polymerase
VNEPPADANRALEALRWAASHAAGAPHEPPGPAGPEDFRAAGRERLEEVRRLLDALLDCGALHALLPSVAAMVGFGDGEWRHKDLWRHTKQVVAQAPATPALRWAALLHDIGKIRTRSIADDGEVHFFGHAEVGARMFDKAQRQLPLFEAEPELRERVRFLVLHHLRASQYAPGWTDSAVRRFAREIGAPLDDLIALSRADITTKRPERKRRGLGLIDELCSRIAALAALDATEPALPPGVGNVIMEAFGLPPSKRIGEIRSKLEEKVEAGEVPPRAEPEVYVAFIRAHADEFGL